MGMVALPVDKLNDRRVQRTWHDLKPKSSEGRGRRRSRDDFEKKEEKSLGKVELAVRWRHNPDRVVKLPEQMDAEDDLNGRPNYLRVAVIRARKLKVMDKALFGKGGSSDPLAVLTMDGETRKTTVKKKNLRPVWNEYLELPVEDEKQIMTLTVEDHDLASGNDFMGDAQVEMETLGDRELRRFWVDIRGGKERNENAGAVEVAVRWAHDPKLVLAVPGAFEEPEEPEHLAEEANELLVVLLRARNLPIMDKNLLSKGGSSDPVVKLNLDGEVRKSQVVKKNLHPVWLESFSFPCDDGLRLDLEVTVEDYDLLGNDFMGQCGVHLADLLELEERRIERVWFPLAPKGVRTERNATKEDAAKRASRGSGGRAKRRKQQSRGSRGDKEGPNLGRVELALRWVHNPAKVIRLPEAITQQEVKPEEAANSVMIVLVRARNLPAMDTSSFGGAGSSDPFCELKVGEETAKSQVKKKDLNPLWEESFELPNAEKTETCVVTVLDFDAHSAPDPIGHFELPVAALADRKVLRRWFGLRDHNKQRTGGKVECAFRWYHNPSFSITMPRDMEGNDDILDMPPNVLRICLMRGRELPVMDKAATKGAAGSSDPYALIKVASAHRDAADRHLEAEPFRSTTKEASLRPVWMERFNSPVDGAEDKILDVALFDADDDGRDDLMGRVKIPLKATLGRTLITGWHELQNAERAAKAALREAEREDNAEGPEEATDTKNGEVEIALRLVYDPRCRVAYYDPHDPKDLAAIAELTVDAVEHARDEPLKLLVVRCAEARHVLVDETQGITPCMVAAARRGPACLTVELLYRLKCDLDQKDKSGRTALHLAAKYDNAAVAKKLVMLDADVAAEDKYGKQPHHYAAEEGNDKVLEALVKLGADLEDETFNGRTALAFAAMRGRSSTVKLLADLGAEVDEPGTMFAGRRPLHFAAASGDEATVKALLRLGADVDAADTMGNLPVHHAALAGLRAMVDLLCEYCDPDAVNGDGKDAKRLLDENDPNKQHADAGPPPMSAYGGAVPGSPARAPALGAGAFPGARADVLTANVMEARNAMRRSASASR